MHYFKFKFTTKLIGWLNNKLNVIELNVCFI